MASDAVSTSIADNPQALTTRPDWVHPVMAPNTYRGLYRGEESTADYVAAALPVLEEIDRKGETLAGFICETVYGNAGGIPPPPGYLKDIYAEVRKRGGICIATEVQVGYGRLVIISGASTSRASSPTSSPSPRAWATASRWAPSSPAGRIAEALSATAAISSRRPGEARSVASSA